MTKDELSQLRWLKREIAMWQQKLDRLESQSLVKGQQITGMPSGGSRTTSKVEDRVIRSEEIRECIRDLKDRAEREQIRLLEYIKSIEDGFIRQIIQYRFAELMSWKEVARRMGEGVTADAVRIAVDRHLRK